MICCWISSIVSLATWLVPIIAVPALAIISVVIIYAVITAIHPPIIEVYESEKTFKDPKTSGMAITGKMRQELGWEGVKFQFFCYFILYLTQPNCSDS